MVDELATSATVFTWHLDDPAARYLNTSGRFFQLVRARMKCWSPESQDYAFEGFVPSDLENASKSLSIAENNNSTL
jgi:hypothetical protein